MGHIRNFENEQGCSPYKSHCLLGIRLKLD
jgi:hypothetical protein